MVGNIEGEAIFGYVCSKDCYGRLFALLSGQGAIFLEEVEDKTLATTRSIRRW